MPRTRLEGKRPALVVLSDVHVGADGHAAEEFAATLRWIRRRPDVRVVLAGDLVDMGLPVAGDKSANAKILGQSLDPTEQILAARRIFEPIRAQVIASVGGNHEARGVTAAMLDVSALLADVLEVPSYLGAAAIRFEWGDGHAAVGIVGHGRSGGANRWREFQAKLVPLYPDADFYSLGHTHDLMRKEVVGLRVDEAGDEHLRRQWFVRSGNYLCRSGSAYSREALYTPLPQGSPIVWFDDDGGVTPDVETLRYWRL